VSAFSTAELHGLGLEEPTWFKSWEWDPVPAPGKKGKVEPGGLAGRM
jgi:hypothetical protein